jgi:predicted nucleic acid-binding protein
MNVLTVLVDSDVLVDFLIDRAPFTVAAKQLVAMTDKKIIKAYLAPHSITNIFYILRKSYSASDRRQMLADLCQSVTVAEVKARTVLDALANADIADVEDGLQAECAKNVNADYIITRNIGDYGKSAVPAILPEDLLKRVST